MSNFSLCYVGLGYMKNKILEVKNITKEFITNKNFKMLACKDISFDVFEGEFLSIIGESGSGKSTLMKIISNLEEKTQGQILFNGIDISNLKGTKLRLHRKNIQFLFQDTASSLNPKMKVSDIICEPLINFNLIKKADKRHVAMGYLKKVELDKSFLSKRPHQMSGGERQRIGIARALTLQPNIIILDEPTSALDSITQAKILHLIKSIQKETGLTIIFICHDLALVTQLSDRIAVMNEGELVEIVYPHQVYSEDVRPYTKQLIYSIFDLKKCRNKFLSA